MNYVIIGNGIAGVRAAEAIRELDRSGRLSMVAEETMLPYCRPMISLLLEGRIPSDRLPIRTADFYQRLHIHATTGVQVNRIDPDERRVVLDNGQTLNFDRLLIASGAAPRPLKVPGHDLAQIFYMRTVDQVQTMRQVLPGVRRVLVLGGGLVGFKAAGALLQQGREVTMLISSAYPLSMQVDAKAGTLLLDELRRHGLKVLVNTDVTAFEGRDRVTGAILSNGRRLPCDMVVVGKGVLPALSFVPRTHIKVDLGIMVNEFQETSLPGIYAAGDVAETMDVARRRPWVNAIWPEAAIQGCIAGWNMAGHRVPSNGSLSRNVIRIFDLNVMTAGLVNPEPESGCEEVIRRDGHGYRKLVLRDNCLVGMVLVNNIEQGGILTALIQSARTLEIPAPRLLDTGFNYASLLQREGGTF